MSKQPHGFQLVLFDGDDGRTEILDDIKQLSEIPSYCEFYIFCDENDSTLEKVLNNLYSLSRVHVRKSAGSISQKLEEFLNENVDEYSCILIVCGPKPSYERLSQSIRKKYSNQKLFVMWEGESSNITIKDILGQIRQQGNQVQVSNDMPYPHCPIPKDDPKNIDVDDSVVSFFDQELYIDSTDMVLNIKKRNKNDDDFIVQCDIRCQHCNEYFQSKKALKEHYKRQVSCDVSK